MTTTEQGETNGGSPELSVILPAHNEVSLLGSTVANLISGLSDRGLWFELVVVENGSHDGTLRLARLLAAQFAEVRVLTRAVGDYGAALAAGFGASTGQVVVNFDVDYYDLAFLDCALTDLRDDTDLVLASKRAPGASDDRPRVRRVLTAGFTTALRLTLNLSVSDTHGMKAYRRDALEGIIEQCTMRGSMFDVEMVVRAERAGLHLREIPARVFERRPPRTSLRQRTVESALGIARLRMLLWLEGSGLPAGQRISLSIRQQLAARVRQMVDRRN